MNGADFTVYSCAHTSTLCIFHAKTNMDVWMHDFRGVIVEA